MAILIAMNEQSVQRHSLVVSMESLKSENSNLTPCIFNIVPSHSVLGLLQWLQRALLVLRRTCIQGMPRVPT